MSMLQATNKNGEKATLVYQSSAMRIREGSHPATVPCRPEKLDAQSVRAAPPPPPTAI